MLDAGALIRGHGLSLYKTAKTIITVPDVIAEIKDSKSRELLAKLPFEIEERMPSQSSINTVAQFAKKTGDYAAISKTDLRLIALTHMLELELNGKKYENDVRIIDLIVSTPCIIFNFSTVAVNTIRRLLERSTL